jgi:DNA repair protein RecO (recombination protein O)
VAPLVARFELDFLAELGFGLDLAACAATGVKDDLIFVSPRSGRAVSRAAGEPYREKLMRLPLFLSQKSLRQAPEEVQESEIAPLAPGDLVDAFALTGFFLDRHAFAPRGLPLPEARAHFVMALVRDVA